jgi:hypothetical protein
MSSTRSFHFLHSARAARAVHGAAVIVVALAALLWAESAARAADCVALLPLFQRGGSDAQVAEATGLPFAAVSSCRRELSRPVYVGPAGAPPMGAAGPPPMGAAGRPPMGAAGAPPMGAAGPPPVGRDVKRLP